MAGLPIIIGEVLFDVFPDGHRVLGGAPFNVAWHLAAFGLRPLLITRVGDDAPGSQVIEAMTAWGMDVSGVQVDGRAPTGQVRVAILDGEPVFDILPNQAYDHLEVGGALAAVRDHEVALVYHGSLIARSQAPRDAIAALRARAAGDVLVDVNLRDPWWSVTGVAELIDGADRLKLNQYELGRLVGGGDELDLELSAGLLAGRHRLRQVVVTRGSEGALVWSAGGCDRAEPPADGGIVDTVGAGDAFSAVWIAGLLGGWPIARTLDRALAFAAAICTIRGATSADRGLYGAHIEGWSGP